MPVRFLSDAQREQLSGFPAELGPESLDRFFTLSGPDLAEVRRRHGDENLSVPIIRPCWSGSMPVLVEDAAEPVSSADIEVRDLLGIGYRSG
jgi:Domain of unknown function (DUF4158)